jgi:hypothetical protein
MVGVSAHNEKLRAAREAKASRWFPGRPMTRSELAHLVVEYVWAHERVEASFDRKHVAKLEAGEIRYPTSRYRRALRAVLGARSDDELGFVSIRRVPPPDDLGLAKAIRDRSRELATWEREVDALDELPPAAARVTPPAANDEDESRPRQKERNPIVPSLNKPLPQE